jgi:hypothetical protein
LFWSTIDAFGCQPRPRLGEQRRLPTIRHVIQATVSAGPGGS